MKNTTTNPVEGLYNKAGISVTCDPYEPVPKKTELYNNIIPFHYNDGQTQGSIQLKESCWIDGKPYFTGQTIGEFLDYSQPRKSINKIIERNPYLDDSAWSTNVKLTSVEGGRTVVRDTRVYNPIALQLIINKSNQPRAIAFQVAVAHLVAAFLSGELTTFDMANNPYGPKYFCHMVASLASIPKRNRMILDCAALNNLKASEVCNLVRRETGLAVSAPRATARKCQDDYDRAMEYHRIMPGYGGRAIKRALSLTASERQINHWIREAMFAA